MLLVDLGRSLNYTRFNSLVRQQSSYDPDRPPPLALTNGPLAIGNGDDQEEAGEEEEEEDEPEGEMDGGAEARVLKNKKKKKIPADLKSKLDGLSPAVMKLVLRTLKRKLGQ